MKKIFSFILLLCAAPAVTAATISQDSYEYPGSGQSIDLGNDILGNKGSFSITYDLVGVNLNDIVTNGGSFFSLTVEDENGTKGSITIAYSSMLGFYSTGLGACNTTPMSLILMLVHRSCFSTILPVKQFLSHTITNMTAM